MVCIWTALWKKQSQLWKTPKIEEFGVLSKKSGGNCPDNQGNTPGAFPLLMHLLSEDPIEDEQGNHSEEATT